MTISVRPVAIWIDGIAPSVLITGCCEEVSDFWSADDLVPPLRSLRAYFDEKRLPYDFVIPPGSRLRYLHGTVEPRILVPPPVVPGTAENAAAVITDEGIRRTAKRFGAKWVNLIGHSKGGLNSRYWISSNTASPNGPGPLSLITLDTPHRGSPFGDLMRTVVEGKNIEPAGEGPLLNKLITGKLENERNSATTRDLGTVYLTTSFNPRFPMLSTARIGSGAERPVKYWALVSDANLNNSTSGGGRLRTISPDETRQITPPEFRNNGLQGRVTSAAALEDMHNLLGWATTVSIIEQRNWLGGTTSYARLNQGQAVFQRNDFVVTMVSQAFVYPRLPNFPIGIGAQGHNHNDLSDGPVAVGIHQALKTLLIP